MPEPSILDARLAEIDRRLRMIQSGLKPVPEPDSVAEPDRDRDRDRESEPAVAAPAPTPLRLPPLDRGRYEPGLDSADDPSIAALTTRLQQLAAVQERLLAATQDLLVDHADAFARAAPAIAVSAGPFADPAALEAFRRALIALPQVGEATVREYTGDERVVLDVHLRGSIS